MFRRPCLRFCAFDEILSCVVRFLKKLSKMMALRGIRGMACMTMSCVKVAKQPLLMCHLKSAYGTGNAASLLHTSQPLCNLDKDIQEKKDLISATIGKKLEVSYANEDGVDLPGLIENGITIPTLETHSMILDGVRYDNLPIVHIKSSPNNTIMTVTDHTGREILGCSSCGQEGFKNVKKSTNVAAQATGLSLGTKMAKKGIIVVRVLIKGLGAGRLASIKGLQMGGLKIISLTDKTHVLHEGPRPRKAKRL